MKSMQKLKKKAQLGNIPNTILLIAIVGVMSVVVAIVLDKLDDGYATSSTQNLIVANGTQFLTNVTGQLPLLGTVIIMGVVISSIIVYFWRKGTR